MIKSALAKWIKPLFLFLGLAVYCLPIKAQNGFSKTLDHGYLTFNVLVDDYDIVTAALFWKPDYEIGIVLSKLDSNGNLVLVDSIVNKNGYIQTGLSGSLQLRDSTYLLVGKQNNPDRCFFLEMDRNFDTLVHTTFNYNGDITSAFTCTPSRDGGTLIAGETFIKHPIDSIRRRGILLTKLNSQGLVLWMKSFEAPQTIGNYIMQNGASVIEMANGSIIVSGGRFNAWSEDDADRVVLKTDSTGNLLWELIVGDSQFAERGSDLIPMTDSTFMLTTAWGMGYKLFQANLQSYSESSFHEIDLDGNILWSKQYKNRGYKNSIGNGIAVTDSTYLITGSFYDGTASPKLGAVTAYVYALDKNGDSLWYREYAARTLPSDLNILFDIAPYPDKGFVAAGRLLPSALSDYAPWIVRADKFGCVVQGCQSISITENVILLEGLDIYPNPSSGSFYLDFEAWSFSELKLTLFNMQGQKVKEIPINAPQQKVEVFDLAPSMYHLELRDGSILVAQEKLFIRS
jgi:hypothetical protein